MPLPKPRKNETRQTDGGQEKDVKEVTGDLSRVIEKLNSSAWAIWPPKLDAIHELINQRLAGDNKAFIEIGGEREGETTYLQVNDDGIAVINIMGTIGQRLNMIEQASGGVSTEILRRDIERAVESPQVKGILLHIDSPGGTVDGTKALADYIRLVSAEKPVYAYTDGMMASAAYWIAAAAEKVFAYPTAEVGSVGVVALHTEFSSYHQKAGIKKTYIYNGKFKRLVNDAEPLSDEGKAYMQELVDGVYDIFVEDIALFRGMETEQIKAHESRMFLAQQARDNGLVDEVLSFNQTYTKLRGRAKIMNYTDLKADHTELFIQVKEEGLKEATANEIAENHPDKVAAWKEEGVQAERGRATGILDAKADPEATVKAIKDGTSVDGAYKLFYENEKIKKADDLKKLETEAPEIVGQEDPDTEKETKELEGDNRPADVILAEKARELAKAEGLDLGEAQARVFKENPDLATRWQEEKAR